ncbi:MAG: serine/threonine protein kinase, partial [Deltaproteobacteria bacterium]|nr:serine/threonine protein kinase [Deltaproteobacteria bacterium]
PEHTPDASGIRALGALSSFAADGHVGAAAAIELGTTLGEGGMGIVRAGTQVALGRSVAVKTLKAGVDGDWATLKMLREAWITGSLEHPNIVPIYDVGVDGDGRPLIILKKIEGKEWSELMGDAAAVSETFGAHDLLEWNLGVLQQVCNAVRFAHSRSILHRDLKPENVMVGEFGEVYLVDWGIAVSTEDDGSGRLPLAARATEMAGTPYYMAPEMLGGGASQLSERTDVYLLGAILYEIVCGRPPHQGMNLMAVIAAAATSSPDVPDTVPDELQQIIVKAMARESAERFATAEAFRSALVEFLEHRGSERLADEAHHRLGHLLGYIAAEDTGDIGARDRIYPLFHECRFGFQSALDAWSDNPDARVGLQRAIEAMVSYELAEGDPRAAATLTAMLAEVPEDLASRIAAAQTEKDDRERRLATFAAIGLAEDRNVGRRTRAFLAAVVGLMWTVAPVLTWFQPERAKSWPLTAAWNLTMFAFMVIAAVWGRESMTKTAFNRRVGATALLAIGAGLPLHLGNWLMGNTAIQSQVMAIAIWATVATYSTFAIDRRLAFSAVVTTAGFLAACVRPDLRWLFVSALSFVILASVIWIWFRLEDVDGVRERLDGRITRLTKRPPSPPPS